jgi:hypothetical protein
MTLANKNPAGLKDFKVLFYPAAKTSRGSAADVLSLYERGIVVLWKREPINHFYCL